MKKKTEQDCLSDLTWSTASVWVPTSHHGNHTQNSCQGASAHSQKIHTNWCPWHSPKSKWKVSSRPIGIFQVRKKINSQCPRWNVSCVQCVFQAMLILQQWHLRRRERQHESIDSRWESEVSWGSERRAARSRKEFYLGASVETGKKKWNSKRIVLKT